MSTKLSRIPFVRNLLSIWLQPKGLRFVAQNARKSLKKTNALAVITDKIQDPSSRGLVLGVYANEEDKLDPGCLTPSASRYNEYCTHGRLLHLLQLAGPMPKRGECRIIYNVDNNFSAVAVCGLGKYCQGYDCNEIIDEGKEAIRRAASTGCVELQKLHTQKIIVENFEHAESAAEGATMGIWAYQELKNKKTQVLMPQLDMHVERGIECDWHGWKIGMAKATAQNLARQMQEVPSNLLTPSSFAQNVVEVLCKSGVNVEVKVKGWIESQKMDSLLAISKASCEQPIFLELSYYGTKREERPIVLIGQGITYDAGGLCAKKYDELKHMRADMTGAACIVATCRAIASLQIPVNLRGLIPVCENVIGCNSFRPGDVLKAMNGKSVEVQRTDLEDALVLIDSLQYAQNFHPKFIIDVGTTTSQIRSAIGDAASGVFTNSLELWDKFQNASIHTGDRVWRFPLWDHFSRHVTASKTVDVQNMGIGSGGYPCKAAAVLREFLPCGQWLHVDCKNVMTTDGKYVEYLRKGMAGRPTRTLIEFIAQLACHSNDGNTTNSNKKNKL